VFALVHDGDDARHPGPQPVLPEKVQRDQPRQTGQARVGWQAEKEGFPASGGHIGLLG